MREVNPGLHWATSLARIILEATGKQQARARLANWQTGCWAACCSVISRQHLVRLHSCPTVPSDQSEVTRARQYCKYQPISGRGCNHGPMGDLESEASSGQGMVLPLSLCGLRSMLFYCIVSFHPQFSQALLSQ